MTDKMIEVLYQTIVEWDEGGGKRSRRELARRIGALLRAPAKEAVTPASFEVHLDEAASELLCVMLSPAWPGSDQHTEVRLIAKDGKLWAYSADHPEEGALEIAEIERLDRAESPVPAARCPVCNGDDAEAPCAYTTERPDGCWRAARLNADAHTDNDGDMLPLSCPMAGQSNCALFSPLHVDPATETDLAVYQKIARNYETDDRPPAAHADNEGDLLPSKPDDLEAMRRDAELLDFVLEQDAFLFRNTTDAGAKVFQLWTQDEDENYHVISGEGQFFKTPRDAIRAAIAAEKREES